MNRDIYIISRIFKIIYLMTNYGDSCSFTAGKVLCIEQHTEVKTCLKEQDVEKEKKVFFGVFLIPEP